MAQNVIIFGEAGSGKSSLVNMIVGKEVADVSGDAGGCTLRSEAYETTIKGTSFRIHDTPGLNEGEQGAVPHLEAIRKLYTLIRQLDSVSLLVYCMQGRVKDNAKSNWVLFNQIICGGNVPIIAVVTALDNYEDPDVWWKEPKNQQTFQNYGMRPLDVACVVSAFGERNASQLRPVYESSQSKLRSLIAKRYMEWSASSKEEWFSDIYQELYKTSFCFVSKKEMHYSEQMRNWISEFKKETRMKEGDAKKLDETLLHAETRFRSPKSRRKGRFGKA